MYTIGSRAFNSPAVSTYGGALVDGIPDEFLTGGIAAPPNLNNWDNILRMRAHLGEKKRTIGLAKSEIALQKAIAAQIRAAEEAGDWGLIEAKREAAKEGHWNHKLRKKPFQYQWDTAFPAIQARAKWLAWQRYLKQENTTSDKAIHDAMRSQIKNQLQTYRAKGPYIRGQSDPRPRLHRFNHDANGLISTLGVANLSRIDPQPRPSTYTMYEAAPPNFEYSDLPAVAAQ